MLQSDPFAGRLMECTGGFCHATYEARFEAKARQEIRTDTGRRWDVFGTGGRRIRKDQ
jgi:hypothetical protein